MPAAAGALTAAENAPADSSPAPPARSRLPLLRVLGQMGGTYVVAEGPDGMYLLDQHAAHERVLFDGLGEDAAATQALLPPASVELTAAQTAALAEYAEDLRAAGFEVDALDGPAVLLRSLPSAMARRGDGARALTDFLDALLSDDRGDGRGWKVKATVACHAAVRSGDPMALEEMRALIEQLERSDEPLACPHGRPTLVHLPVELLDRQFGRTWR